MYSACILFSCLRLGFVKGYAGERGAADQAVTELPERHQAACIVVYIHASFQRVENFFNPWVGPIFLSWCTLPTSSNMLQPPLSLFQTKRLNGSILSTLTDPQWSYCPSLFRIFWMLSVFSSSYMGVKSPH